MPDVPQQPGNVVPPTSGAVSPVASPPPVAQPASSPPVQAAPPPAPQPQIEGGGETARSLVDILFADGSITAEQHQQIKLKSVTEGKSPTEILKSMQIVSGEKIAEAQAKLLGVPYIGLASASFSPQALNFLSRAVVERFLIIPFSYDEASKTLSVAMANPVDLDALAFIRQKTGLTIKAFASTEKDVKDAIEQQYRQELVGEIGKAIKESEELTQKRTVDSTKIAEIIQEAPIAKIVTTILDYATTSRASDIHIEPQDDRVRVRYRIDGILYDKLSLPRNVADALTSRIKILAELKIDEHRIPQDGRFTFKVNEEEADIRVSTLPTVKGEKIVMRLLRKTGGIPTLGQLGLNGASLKALENAILRPHGIILVCGPTGSGKTTTLYSVLSRLNTTRVNIASLEDPVEYELPGVNQVQINPAVGLTFASGLRSFLRQDPNIILVGEIRDKETTDLAIQAALTGHLVFSTLHTSSASGALPRLIDLGAERFLIASTVNAIAGQRIVRQICPHCKETFAPPQQLITEMRSVLGNLYPADAEGKLFRGKGCNECGTMGYLGRLGIYEVLPISERITRLVLEKIDALTVEKEAMAEGMITMKQDGYLKVLRGETTIEEVLRVAEE